jgi:hypothetical protein
MSTQTVSSGIPQPVSPGGLENDAQPPAQPPPGKKRSGARNPGERSLAASPTTWFVWAGMAAFFIFLVGILVSVVVDSLGKPWFDSWLPENFATSWYSDAWNQFGMAHIIVVTLIVALTGFYMTDRLGLWDRFRSGEFWWMHAMVGVWLLFTVILFVAEPLVLDRWFHERATTAPDAAFAWLQRAHWLLLVISLITILAAVAGSHGMSLL